MTIDVFSTSFKRLILFSGPDVDSPMASDRSEPKVAGQGAAAKHPSSHSAAPPSIADDAQTVIRGSSKSASERASRVHSDRTPMAVAQVLLGQRLNHFELLELIGGGGMGAVFRAHDEHLGRTVAVKVIPFVSEDPDLNRRFRNEAQSAAKLDHPNIARVFDVGNFENWHYLVFEFVRGVNIRDRVLRGGPFSIDDAVFATCQLASAIGHAAERGIVHRDIKPSNVLIDQDEQTKLVDMGLARSDNVEISEDMTASGVTLGTFDYISPEQALDPRDADVRSDIYSLGCTLYFMLTGQPPYPGGTMLQKLLSHGNAPPPDARTLRRELSEDLSRVVQKMLAKTPADRYQTVGDLSADLREIAKREGLPRTRSISGTLPSPEVSILPWLSTYVPWLVAAGLLVISAGWMQLSAILSGDRAIISVPEEATMVREVAANAPPDPISTSSESREVSEDSFQLSDPPKPQSRNDQAARDVLDGDAMTPDPPNSGAVPGSVDLPDEERWQTDQIVGSGADVRTGAFDDGEASMVDADSTPESDSFPPFDDSETGFRAIRDGVATAFSEAMRAIEKGAGGDDGSSTSVPSVPFELVTPKSIRVYGPAEKPFPQIDLSANSIEGIAYASSLSEAIDMADRLGVDLIELAEPVVTTSPLQIRRDGLTIASLAGRSRVVVESSENSADVADAPRPGMLDVRAERIVFQDLDFVWELSTTDKNGRSLFSMTSNRMFRMDSCTVTVRNPERYPNVSAIAVRPVGNGQSLSGDNELVSIELVDVVIRGEMSMLRMEVAAELQLRWDNGFLAVPRWVIDGTGSSTPPDRTDPVMQVELSRLTAFIPGGFFRMRLAEDRVYPVALHRRAERCVFIGSADRPHVLIDRLPISSTIREVIRLRGSFNAYVWPGGTDLTEPLLEAINPSGVAESFPLDVLVSESPPEWTDEEFPRWSVRWSAIPPDGLPSEMVPTEFRQDGAISSGFDEQTLPTVPTFSDMPTAD